MNLGRSPSPELSLRPSEHDPFPVGHLRVKDPCLIRNSGVMELRAARGSPADEGAHSPKFASAPSVPREVREVVRWLRWTD